MENINKQNINQNKYYSNIVQQFSNNTKNRKTDVNFFQKDNLT